MESDQRCDVHIGDAITVGEAEGTIIQVGGHPLEPPSGEGSLTGIHQGDLSGLGLLVVHLHLVRGHIEGDIAIVQKIIGEIFLDHIALVATADHKIVDAWWE